MRSKKSSHEQKQHDGTLLVVLLLLSPYIVGFSHPDSSYSFTETMYGIGGGQYVYHDCSGAHKQRFTDAGIYVGKKFEGPYRVGISAGGWALEENGLRGIAYPDFALDWENFSIGTTGIRFGSQHKLYFESKWLDQPPLLSGKGLGRFGIGGRIGEPFSNFWIGGNVIPYNRLGFAAQLEFPWRENSYLFLNGRFGKDKESGFSEFGFSIGMRVISSKDRQVFSLHQAVSPFHFQSFLQHRSVSSVQYAMSG